METSNLKRSCMMLHLEDIEDGNQLQVHLFEYTIYVPSIAKFGWTGETNLTKNQVDKLVNIFSDDSFKQIGFDIDGNLILKVFYGANEKNDLDQINMDELSESYGFYVFDYQDVNKRDF